MIINIDEIYERLTDLSDWEPIYFENHRGEKLYFSQVATLDHEGKTYAYLYETNENGEQVTKFPAVVLLEELDGEYKIDFVTDKKLIEEIGYEVYIMRRGEAEAEEAGEFYEEDDYPEDGALDGEEQ